MTKRIIIVIAVLAALTGLLFWAFPEVPFNDDSQARYIYLLMICAYLIFSLLQKRLNLSDAFKYVLIWVAIGLVIMTGYAFRHELTEIKERLAMGIYPANGTSASQSEMRFEVAEGDHFYINAVIKGVTIQFMLDTGASRVVLNPKDAERLGYDAKELSFSSQTSTANGTVWSALTKIDSIRIGNHAVNDVPASISQNDLDISLLGMSFLNKIKGYSVEKGVLTLQF